MCIISGKLYESITTDDKNVHRLLEENRPPVLVLSFQSLVTPYSLLPSQGTDCRTLHEYQHKASKRSNAPQ
jgi:hypothetical protein